MAKNKRVSVTITELEDGYFAEINAGWRKNTKLSSDTLLGLLRKIVAKVNDSFGGTVLLKDVFEEA